MVVNPEPMTSYSRLTVITGQSDLIVKILTGWKSISNNLSVGEFVWPGAWLTAGGQATISLLSIVACGIYNT